MRVLLFNLIFCITKVFCVKYEDYEMVQKINTVTSISTNCMRSLELLKKNLNSTEDEQDIWALQMLDAGSKTPVGILSYNFQELGNFKQCVEIESRNDHIIGKYCLGNIEVNTKNIDDQSVYIQNHIYLKTLLIKIAGGTKLVGNPTWAMCIPSNCTDNDAKNLLKLTKFGINIESVTCQTLENVNSKLTDDAIAGISILTTLVLIVIIATAIDLYYENKPVKAHRIFTAFSLYTNGKTIFTIPKRSSNLSCLDGLKVLSMFWIVILHTYSVYTSGPIFNQKDVVNFTNSWISMIFINGDLACDTFLLVGGTLVTYIYFKQAKNTTDSFWGILRHYFHRYIRLTPPLAGVVLLSATLIRYMGSGPKWPYIISSFEGFCKTYWWSALLYVQNEVNVHTMCVGHSWYLNVDMQLFLLSPLIFYLLKKRTALGIFLITVTAVASISISFYRAYIEEMSGVSSTYYPKVSSDVYMNDYYLKTETRAAPWLMGIILGYILANKKYTEVTLSKKIILPIWLFSLALILTCVFGGHGTLRRPEYFRMQNAFYIALIRPSFALSVGWIIWACSTNHGGIINKILSLPIFQFLNKFIYSMYLLHVNILYMIIFSSETTIYFSIFNLAYWFWGIFMLSFGLSIIWVMVFEYPMILIEKIILPR